jgi:hypothetical protein|tara:strand:- start:1575 stop:2387 length:813 start_codon:yes stop_codon:yes gene_type:complete
MIMKFKSRHIQTMLCVISFCLLHVNAQAQNGGDDGSIEGFDLSEEREAYQRPDAVGEDIGPDALRFFFLSATLVNESFYYREGEDYQEIQAAYNSFGNMHRVSARPKLELCKKVTRALNGEPKDFYVPVLELNANSRPDLFAVFLPSIQMKEGEVYPLNALNFSEKVFPYNQITFMNILPKPVMVLLGEQQGIVKPGQILRSRYTTQRKGVGYLRVAVAIRDVDSQGKLLFNQQMPVFKDQRTIAIPIAGPLGGAKIKVISYRDTGADPR